MDNRPLYNGCLAKKRKRESILIEEIKNAPKERAEEMIKSLHSENNSEHWSQVRKVLNYYYSLLIKDEIFVSVNFLTSSTGRAGSGSLIYPIQGTLSIG